ncbi:hypothetical protein ACLOJK_031965 [Asimina triloba]
MARYYDYIELSQKVYKKVFPGGPLHFLLSSLHRTIHTCLSAVNVVLSQEPLISYHFHFPLPFLASRQESEMATLLSRISRRTLTLKSSSLSPSILVSRMIILLGQRILKITVDAGMEPGADLYGHIAVNVGSSVWSGSVRHIDLYKITGSCRSPVRFCTNTVAWSSPTEAGVRSFRRASGSPRSRINSVQCLSCRPRQCQRIRSDLNKINARFYSNIAACHLLEVLVRSSILAFHLSEFCCVQLQ